MRFPRRFAMALFALLSCGCAGLHSSQATTQLYTLAPVFTAVAGPSAGPSAGTPPGSAMRTLQVARPLAAPGLGSERIALQRDGQRLDYYAASSWPAPLPDLVQTLAIDALRAQGDYRAVESEGAAFAADDLLQIEIRDCQAQYAGDGPPTVRVQLLATLARRSDRSLLASVSADASAVAGENRMRAVVAAFQAAVGTALRQLASGLAAAGAPPAASAPPAAAAGP